MTRKPNSRKMNKNGAPQRAGAREVLVIDAQVLPFVAYQPGRGSAALEAASPRRSETSVGRLLTLSFRIHARHIATGVTQTLQKHGA